jgi:hypothetical protein
MENNKMDKIWLEKREKDKHKLRIEWGIIFLIIVGSYILSNVSTWATKADPNKTYTTAPNLGLNCTIIYPNKDAHILTVGSNPITWKCDNVSLMPTVKIELWQAYLKIKTLTPSLENTGTFAFVIESSDAYNLQNYQLCIANPNNDSQTFWSVPFTINMTLVCQNNDCSQYNLSPVGTGINPWQVFAYIICVIFVILLYAIDFIHHPHVAFATFETKSAYAGKYISSRYDEVIGKYKHIFADGKCTRTIYSDETYEMLKRFQYHSFARLYDTYPHYILIKFRVPEKCKVPLDIPKITFGNSVLFLLYLLVRLTAFSGFALELYNAIAKENFWIEEVDEIINDLQMKSLEHTFSVSYQIEEIDKTTGKMELVSKIETDISYAQVESIRKKDAQDLKIVYNGSHVVEYRTIDEAMHNRQSCIEQAQIYEYKLLDMDQKLKGLEKNLSIERDSNRQLFNTRNQDIEVAIRPYRDLVQYNKESIPLLLAKAFRRKDWGLKDEENLNLTIKEAISAGDTERKRLLTENVELNVKLDLLKQELLKKTKPDLTRINVISPEPTQNLKQNSNQTPNQTPNSEE